MELNYKHWTKNVSLQSFNKDHNRSQHITGVFNSFLLIFKYR